MAKYLMVHSFGKWTDEQGVTHEHWMEAVVRPFTGRRPKGRCYKAEVYMVVDHVVAEHNKPTTFKTFPESTQWLMGSIPEDWVEVA